MDRGIKILATGFGLLFLLIIIASTSNSGKYYLEPNDGTLEIWKGNFAPMGKSMIVSMPNVPEPNKLKETYTKEEIFPMVFAYYIDQADKLLDTDELPDFEGIKTNVSMASDYSISPEHKEQALVRLYKIDQMILIYKADVAASRETIESLEQAMDYLEEANEFEGDQFFTTMITEKQNKIAEMLSSLEGAALIEKNTEEPTEEMVTEPAQNEEVSESAKTAVGETENPEAKDSTADQSADANTKSDVTEKEH